MTDSPYPEGWPKTMAVPNDAAKRMDNYSVVPLSDAERMRTGLEVLHNMLLGNLQDQEPIPWGVVISMESMCRAALNSERGALDPDKPLEPDPTVEVPFGAPVDEVK